MSEAPEDPKPPKIPRQAHVTDEPKHVRFQANGGTTNGMTRPPTPTPTAPGTCKAGQDNTAQQQQQQPVNTQPTSFPQLGAPPNSAFGAGQWHTTSDPTQSLHQFPFGGQVFNTPWSGGLPPGGGCFANAPPGANFFAVPSHLVNHTVFPAFTSPPFPFAHVGLPRLFTAAAACPQRFHPLLPTCCTQPWHSRLANNLIPWITRGAIPNTDNRTMAGYHNAVPPPYGVNFQPPVPDTTFGPIPHVYVPRFDGGCASGVQVGQPPVQFVSEAPPFTTVLVPKTFYVDGYTYYASEVATSKMLSRLTSARDSTFVSVASTEQPAFTGMPVGQPGYVVAQQPAMIPQPVNGQQTFMVGGQPMMAAGAHPQTGFMPGGQAVMGGGVPLIPGNGGNPPDVSGLGRTQGEETLRQVQFAHANKLFEPQDFKPADDDPSRYYYVREVDGNWTQRSRFTIDHLGDCRWYVTDEGWFYAVRLPD